MFPWLGILRIVLYDRDAQRPEVAVSGVVLIKRDYVLINAHDVSNVPLDRLKQSGQVMFFSDTDTAWYCKPKSYSAHPEYGAVSQSTLAVMELDLQDTGDYPLSPICWSNHPYNTSTYLYTAGFTDEHKTLEKVIHKVQYADKTSCSEFYNRAKLGDQIHDPVNYVCAYAAFSKNQCVWDNGMVLISNATGYFSLIGFGIRGPGCAAPARFIDIQYYTSWLEEIIKEHEVEYDYRRIGGFEEVPIHRLLEQPTKFRAVLGTAAMPPSQYQKDMTSLQYFNIDKEEKGAITVFPFNNTYEAYDKACDSWKRPLYSEDFKINAQHYSGHLKYKISLYDLLLNKCSCIKINIHAANNTEAILSTKEAMDLSEGQVITSSEEIYNKLLIHYPINELYTTPKPGGPWKPGPFLQASHINEFFPTKNVPNYNLYIDIQIKNSATLDIKMYGIRNKPTTTVAPQILRAKEKKIQKNTWRYKEPTTEDTAEFAEDNYNESDENDELTTPQSLLLVDPYISPKLYNFTRHWFPGVKRRKLEKKNRKGTKKQDVRTGNIQLSVQSQTEENLYYDN